MPAGAGKLLNFPLKGFSAFFNNTCKEVYAPLKIFNWQSFIYAMKALAVNKWRKINHPIADGPVIPGITCTQHYIRHWYYVIQRLVNGFFHSFKSG